jgi:hypothetical protein
MLEEGPITIDGPEALKPIFVSMDTNEALADR